MAPPYYTSDWNRSEDYNLSRILLEYKSKMKTKTLQGQGATCVLWHSLSTFKINVLQAIKIEVTTISTSLQSYWWCECNEENYPWGTLVACSSNYVHRTNFPVQKGLYKLYSILFGWSDTPFSLTRFVLVQVSGPCPFSNLSVQIHCRKGGSGVKKI